MKLAEYTQGRENNLHLIRIVAAYAVLVSHSFVLATGEALNEPFVSSLGVTLGAIAVWVFFLASGLLITASLLVKQDLNKFISARALRIFPALFVMLILTVFIMGPTLSTVPLITYLTDAETYHYLIKSATLLTGIGKTLPGLFEQNPFPGAVNGSLWTLKYEIRMYVILALTWFVLTKIFSGWAHLFKIAIFTTSAGAGCLHVMSCMGYVAYRQDVQLFFMFFTGTSFYLLRHRIEMSWRIFFAMVAILAASLVTRLWFSMALTLTLPYLLFFLAYVPSGAIRKYNKVGDYSYGIYIYAFPIQQAVATCWPEVSAGGMIALSTLIVLPLAMASWHLVEKPAMKWKFTNAKTRGLVR